MKNKFIFLCNVVIIGILFAMPSFAGEIVDFVDLELENYLVNEFDGIDGSVADGFISKDEANVITMIINLNNGTITSLGGLEHFHNLEILDLSNQMIGDISALKDLVILSEVILTNNQISDISSLSGKPSLNILDLSFNPLNSSITPGAIHRKDMDFTVAIPYEVWKVYGELAPITINNTWFENELFAHIDDMAHDDILWAEIVLSRIDQGIFFGYCEDGLTLQEKIDLLNYLETVFTSDELIKTITILHKYDAFSLAYFL